MAQGLKSPASVHEDAGLTPGLALPQAVVWVEEAAQIPCCCGCGAGQRLQLRFDP